MSVTAWPDGSISICYEAAKAAALGAKAVADARAKGLRQSPAVREGGLICIRMTPPGPCDHVR